MLKTTKIAVLFLFPLCLSVICVSPVYNEITKAKTAICSNAERLKTYLPTVKAYRELSATIKACQLDPRRCQDINCFIAEIEPLHANINLAAQQFENGAISFFEFERTLKHNAFMQQGKITDYYHEHIVSKTTPEALEIKIKALELVEKEQVKLKNLVNTLKQSLKSLSQELHKKTQ